MWRAVVSGLRLMMRSWKNWTILGSFPLQLLNASGKLSYLVSQKLQLPCGVGQSGFMLAQKNSLLGDCGFDRIWACCILLGQIVLSYIYIFNKFINKSKQKGKFLKITKFLPGY